MICAGVGEGEGDGLWEASRGVGVGHGCWRRCTGSGMEEVLSILGSAAILPA